jgi:hypothetical protein
VQDNLTYSTVCTTNLIVRKLVIIQYINLFSMMSLTCCSNSNDLLRTAEKLAILSVCKSFIPCLNSRTLARFACYKEEQVTFMIPASGLQ